MMRSLRTSLRPLRYGSDYDCVPVTQLQIGEVIGTQDAQFLLVARCYPAGSITTDGREVARFYTIPLGMSPDDVWIAEGDSNTYFMRVINAEWLAELHGNLHPVTFDQYQTEI